MNQVETTERADIFGRTEAEVRAALEEAVPNALRVALYHATRDPELVTMKVEKIPFWGGAYQVPILAEEHVARVREKTFEFLRRGAPDTGGQASEEELRAMMGMMHGQPVDDFNYIMGRGDVAEDEFPLGVEWKNPPSAEARQAFKVIVVGAGFAGLATGIQLQRLGIPYEIIERNPRVGGTWYINDYPEARVDIASHHYQFSFMKNYPWKHYFATQEELLNYAEAVADRYDLKKNIRFDTLLHHARWDEEAKLWRLRMRNPDGSEEEISANAVISAAGLFNAPAMPDIPGIEDFQGEMFHTTQWNHDYDYSGKRVGQIGVGSTGSQLAPAVARKAQTLTVFQRSPQWVSQIEGYHAEVSSGIQWLFDNFPHYWGWYCYSIFSINMGDPEGLQNFDPEWQKQGGLVSKRNDGIRAHNIEYIKSKVGHDPELVRKLTPDFPPFAKRPVVDNGWFDTLNRPNVELVTDAIERFTPTGIRTVDGKERDFDLVLLCAGFKTERYLWPVEYIGRNGANLETAWEKDGARAYLGISMPDFPNLFIIYGPNGQGRAGGLIKWLEMWSRYAVKSICRMIETGARSMDVRPDIFADYNRRMDKELEKCIWDVPGQKSYYVNDFGRQAVNMPWKPAKYHEWIVEPDLTDYRVD